MFCGNCGKQISDDARACPYCGASTGVMDETPVPPYNQQDYGAQRQPYTRQDFGAQRQPYAQQDYGAQRQPYNQQDYGAQRQPYTRQDYGAQRQPYTRQDYGAYNGPGYNTDEFPENGFDAVNKVIQAKLGYVDYREITHPYQRLGGFLAVATYRWGVMAVILAYTAIQFLISMSSVNSLVSSFSGGYGGVSGALSGMTFLIFAVMCAVIAINLLMFIFIEKKNTVFLKFYEIVAIVTISLLILFSILTMTGVNSLGMASGYVMPVVTGILFPVLFWTVIGFGVWILYFAKSVRVRTYFGTDEYLRRSIFCKRSVYPLPLVQDRPVM